MSEPIFAGLGVKLQGHLKIVEYQSRKDYAAGIQSRVVVNKRNAIHKDNASILIVKAMTNQIFGSLAYMAFGNGGTSLDSTGTVLFNPPNVTGPDQNLYNQVFFHLVDDRQGALPGNAMTVRHIANSLFSDMEIRCLLDIEEPFYQLPSFDINGINLNTEQFKFDEIALKQKDGTLITHVVFAPVLKTASTLLEIIYTIRIAITTPDTPEPVPAIRFMIVGTR